MRKMNNSSYKDYLTEGLFSLSKNFTVKTYKLANQEEWYGFERGLDLKIQIQWKGKCIWEWIIEKSFWLQRNTNKEDRIHMRNHVDIKLKACKKSLVKNKTTVSTPKTKTTLKSKIGQTQELFEKMKSK